MSSFTSEAFRARREKLGSLRTIAHRLEISPGQLSLMETGRRPFRRLHWLALAQLEKMAEQDPTSTEHEARREAASPPSPRRASPDT